MTERRIAETGESSLSMKRGNACAHRHCEPHVQQQIYHIAANTNEHYRLHVNCCAEWEFRSSQVSEVLKGAWQQDAHFHGDRVAQQQCDEEQVRLGHHRHDARGILLLSGCPTPLQDLR